MKLTAVLLGLAISVPVSAQVLIQEGFESAAPGTNLFGLGPDWIATTGAFKVDNQPGLAATGDQYLVAPSLAGAGAHQRYGWFDASAGFNARNAGADTIIATVKMFIPKVIDSTYGGMTLYDQLGNSMAVIGVDMAAGKTLTNATMSVNDVAVNLGAYNDIELLADFASGQIDYRFNGMKVGSIQMSASSLAAGLGDFDFYNNGFNAASSVAFRYDDYEVQAVAAPIPEPSTFALVALGTAALLVRRKTRA